MSVAEDLDQMAHWLALLAVVKGNSKTRFPLWRPHDTIMVFVDNEDIREKVCEMKELNEEG